MTSVQSSGGANLDPRGTQDENPNNTTPTESESISYETHKKLLSEKKKRDEENQALKRQLEDFLAKEKAREEEELKKQKNFEQLLKLREEELQKEREEKNSLRSMAEKGLKRRSFLDAVNGAVDEQYWGLIDLNEIVIDPTTGVPDEQSVQKAAREFEKKYPLVLQKRSGGPRLPGDAPRGSGGKLTYEEWLSLPLKEQKARLKEVM